MLFFLVCVLVVVGAMVMVRATKSEAVVTWMLLLGILLMGVAFSLMPISLGVTIRGW
jgi:hypothetical protein